FEQGSTDAGYTHRHVTARARRGRDRLEERRLVASRRRSDPIPAPVGKGGDLAGALDRNDRAAVAAPVSQIVGTAKAADLGGQLPGRGGIAPAHSRPAGGAAPGPATP